MTQSRNDEERNSSVPDSGFKRNYTYIHIYSIEYPIALNKTAIHIVNIKCIQNTELLS